MMRKVTSAAGGAALLLVCCAATPHRADAQNAQSQISQGAAAFIQNLGTEAVDVLGPSVPSGERIAMFRRLLNDDFDLPDAARFVLGPYARELTPAQRQQFVALFRDELAKSYADRLGQYSGDPFRVTGVRPMGNVTLVSSEIMRHGSAPVHIDWQVVRHGARFLITDVYVDNVSEKLAQRNEFIGIIQRNGGQPDAVIAALRQELQVTPAVESGSSSPPTPYR